MSRKWEGNRQIPGGHGTCEGEAGQRWNLEYPRHRLLAFLDTEGIARLDLTNPIRAASKPNVNHVMYAVEAHLTAAGHELVAHELAPFVAGQLRGPAKPVSDSK